MRAVAQFTYLDAGEVPDGVCGDGAAPSTITPARAFVFCMTRGALIPCRLRPRPSPGKEQRYGAQLEKRGKNKRACMTRGALMPCRLCPRPSPGEENEKRTKKEKRESWN